MQFQKIYNWPYKLIYYKNKVERESEYTKKSFIK